jgi:hypothetical protein
MLKSMSSRTDPFCSAFALAVLGFWLVANSVFAATNQIQFLSGTDKDHTVPWEFRVSAGRRAGEWATVPVPGCWEMHGFGTYRYGSWGPEDESGEYRKNFDAPAAWAGKRVFIVFEGAMTEAETRINGLPAGGVPGGNIHRGGFYEFSHEITGQVKPGAPNLLEVAVRKISADAALNTAERKGDYWNFGGLFRPVYLEARPAAHVERVAVDARHDGALTVDVFPSGLDRAALASARVTTLSGEPVGAGLSAPIAAGAASVRLAATIPGVAPWSDEFPRLYRLHVELRDAVTKDPLHTITRTIGFRTVSFVRGEGFRLNGRRVRLRGTSHHEFWPTTGRTSSRAQHAADLELMKAMNMNVVRRAHYPASREFYEEADRIGILVIDELGGWQNKYGDADAARLCRELVVRDVNHPCVIAWGNGNEGGWNTTVDDDFARWDPQARPVIHPANWDHEMSGLKTHHYSDYEQIRAYLGAGKAAFLPTENLHALYDGGGGAGLRDYWDAIRGAPNGAGLLIWGFLDEALARDDMGGKLFGVGDAAPDGIVGPFREKEASFDTIRALWSPVQIAAPGLADGSGAAAPGFTVENRLVFTDLSRCAFRWRLGRFPGPETSEDALAPDFVAEADSGPFAGPALPPGSSGPLDLRLPSGWREHDALRLTVSDPHGRELHTWTWPLRSARETHARLVNDEPNDSARIVADVEDDTLTVVAGARAFDFDLNTGRLLGAAVSERRVPLANGPRPVVGEWNVARVVHGLEGADYVVSVNPAPDSPDAFRWRVRPDGWLRLDYHYTLHGEQPWLGVTFDYPEDDVLAMRWLGRGPGRVWKNRLAGPGFGVHRKTANNTNTAKEDWVYPEFRGYHADLRWAVIETKGEPLLLVTPTPGLFLRMLGWPDASDSRPGLNVARPPGDLSLLHGINAIGHKFGDAASLGPEGRPNLAQGRYSGAVDLWFGAPPADPATR